MSNRITTLEKIVDDLDSRGLLVLQVLLGQQAMKLLTVEKVKEKSAEDIRKISLSTSG